MRKSLKLILIYVLLLPLSATNIFAQFTNTSQGIIVSIDGKKVELAVAKTAAFRISMKYSGTPAALSTTSINNSNQTNATFTVVDQAPVYGIQTSYGKLLVNTTTKNWMLYDATGNLLIPNGTFTSTTNIQTINDGEKSSGTLYGSGNFGSKNLIKTRSNAYSGNGIAGVPYFWNTVGYSALGVSSDDNTPAQWTKTNNAVSWQFNGAAADLYIWPAKTQYDALRVLSELTGKSALPPKWAFGFLQSQWGWKNRAYIEDALTQFRARKLPVDAFIYDFEWYTVTPDYSLPKEGKVGFSDFDFYSVLFNEPAQQIADYKTKGLKSMGIRKPRLGNTDNLNYARSKGWLKFPNTDSRDLDFSIEAMRNWYIEQMRPLLKAGMNAWWNDEGESYYSLYYWWNKAQVDLMKSERPNDRNFSVNRAYSLGVQPFGFCAWTGDIQSDWLALQNTPADLLNWSLAGMNYGSCDLGGFQGTPTNEGMVRWYQAGVFFPIMRAHSTLDAKARFPWLYGVDAEAAIKKALNLRYQLLPYLYSLAHETYTTGAPIMRPLVMEFPNDSNVTDLKDEWLLGKGLLAAPLLNEGGKRSIYLPKDTWYDFNKNTAIQGPATFSVSAALDEIPVYVRAGTILPIAPVVQYTDQDTLAPLEIRIYPGKDGAFAMTEDDGKTNDYTQNDVRTTSYTWNDATKTLSWTVNGNFTNSHVYTTIKAVLGNEEKTATLGTSGTLVFSSFQLPVISPEPGTYKTAPTVSINAPTGATVYYTLDGSTPTRNSAIYSKPFTIPERFRVAVKAFISVNGVDYPVTTANYSVINCQGEGALLMEKWTGLNSSMDISSIPVNTTPNVTSYITKELEISANSAQNYGVKVSGYLTAPETGNYTFYVSGDDNVQLRLGTTSNPSSLTRIAYINGDGWTNSRVWDKYPSQKSASIALTGCQSYPIEVLLKQASGGCNMAVRWVTPSGIDEVIPCQWLSTPGLDACTVNKSYQKSVTASGQVSDNESAVNAVDGESSTKWCSANGGDKWMEIDLGSDMEICRWHVLHAGSESANFITSDFKLQKKVGTSWVNVDIVSNNVENETEQAVAPFTARYVRLYITKPELNNANGVARIYDFSVFGSDKKQISALPTIEDNDAINLFPNPTQSKVMLEIKNTELTKGKVDVINSEGVVVKSFPIKSNKETLNIASLRSGIYFFRIQTNSFSPVIKKLIKS